MVVFLFVNVSSRIVVCFRSIDVVDDETPWITEKRVQNHHTQLILHHQKSVCILILIAGAS